MRPTYRILAYATLGVFLLVALDPRTSGDLPDDEGFLDAVVVGASAVVALGIVAVVVTVVELALRHRRRSAPPEPAEPGHSWYE